ncbi:MAG: MarR family transcriptional regulator [Aliivibrio sp.]|uniref:MarR family winged helix-turn-helix transcriptional regulator n=1 Tax=Aliivibrio sp. TaxID=1872443 RepID=UPI001A3FB129|nr:MarR family transcriptional regulator [Aliivibrio sp.]
MISSEREYRLEIESFFPYQLTQLQGIVSDCIAEIYTGQFDLTRDEWRVLAVLGSHAHLTAKALAPMINLEKMAVSRAIKRMISNQLITKTADSVDKRAFQLSLTEKGKVLRQQLIPKAMVREQQLLSVLDKKEQKQMFSLMEKLKQRSIELLEKKC